MIRVSREELYWCLQEKNNPEKYICIVQDVQEEQDNGEVRVANKEAIQGGSGCTKGERCARFCLLS